MFIINILLSYSLYKILKLDLNILTDIRQKFIPVDPPITPINPPPLLPELPTLDLSNQYTEQDICDLNQINQLRLKPLSPYNQFECLPQTYFDFHWYNFILRWKFYNSSTEQTYILQGPTALDNQGVPHVILKSN